MGFAWHKLFPRPIDVLAASGGTCVGPTGCTSGDVYISNICIGYCPDPDYDGTGTCIGYLETCYLVTGPACDDFLLVPSQTLGIRTNPGCPQEYQFDNFEHRCTFANDPVSNQNLLSDYPYTFWGISQLYYHRTPTTPTSTPSTVRVSPLCLTYETMTVPDRVHFISGRNRYRYTGYLSGEYPPIEFGEVRAMRNLVLGSQNPYASQTTLGIIGYEQSLGRNFPLADSYMQLPLFGASQTGNPPDPSGCFDFCYSGECISCRTDTGIGHYSGRYPNGPGNAAGTDGKGYYSFQCFNPFSWYLDIYDTPLGSVTPDKQDIPLCSVWSLLNAVSERVMYSTEELFSDIDPFVSGYILNTDTIFALDPTTLTGGVQMVAWVMDQFESAVNAHDGTNTPPTGTPAGFGFKAPNVFLWDPIAVTTATTNAQKWQNIFVVGNQNFIFDTGCTHTHVWAGGSSWSGGTGSNVVLLDQVSHSDSHPARMIIWQGCNANAGPVGAGGSIPAGEPSRDNNISKMRLSLRSIACASPKGSYNWCADCSHPGEVQTAPCLYGTNLLDKFC